MADNLERAASSTKAEDLAADPDLRKMHAGVTHMQKVLKEALKDHGARQCPRYIKVHPCLASPPCDLSISWHVDSSSHNNISLPLILY